MNRSLLLGLLSPLLLSACASLQQGNALAEEKNLEQAGFHITTAQTPGQQSALAAMTPYKLESQVEKGKTVYRYADPKEKKIYTGGSQEYSAYQEISFREQQNVSVNSPRTDITRQAVLMR